MAPWWTTESCHPTTQILGISEEELGKQCMCPDSIVVLFRLHYMGNYVAQRSSCEDIAGNARANLSVCAFNFTMCLCK